MGSLLDLVFCFVFTWSMQGGGLEGEDRLGAIMGDDGRALGVDVVVVMICAGMTVVRASLWVRRERVDAKQHGRGFVRWGSVSTITYVLSIE